MRKNFQRELFFHQMINGTCNNFIIETLTPEWTTIAIIKRKHVLSAFCYFGFTLITLILHCEEGTFKNNIFEIYKILSKISLSILNIFVLHRAHNSRKISHLCHSLFHLQIYSNQQVIPKLVHKDDWFQMPTWVWFQNRKILILSEKWPNVICPRW